MIMKTALLATLALLSAKANSDTYPLIMWGPNSFKESSEVSTSVVTKVAVDEMRHIAREAKFVIILA
jgi:hypothetical protein